MGKGLCSLLAIIEMDFRRAKALVILVALAGQQDQIAGLADRDGRLDRRCSISDHLQISADGNTGEHIVKDLLWILGAGVIGGQHQLISQPRCDSSHLRSLAAVTITSATKQANQAALSKGPAGQKRIFKAIGGVGVIHKHGRLGRSGRHPLHAARHTMEAVESFQ